ncbi:hypothetical protein [Thiocapsa roseopersicina]|uniref:Sulfotransferase family protein n=1 Tax=Thiocapsa roseopersicina TaxID=1058 RepID=A0A1H2UJ44_THIRO|nr:hypothetical protein [Thiocapsa roseopersicina]SDW56102.1 hypothetical protein SAMN05421783_105135 [Thiocapsa roseopersicina]
MTSVATTLLKYLPTRTRRTFVVLGCPRGGTSLLAGALSAAGVHMGRYRTLQYEDPEFRIPPTQAGEALERLAPVIRRRNLLRRHWGWKVPNNIYYIDRVKDLLINPCFLFVYRDPLEIARSSASHDGRDWEEQRERLIEVALNHTEKVRRFQESLQSPHHVFRVDTIQADPAIFVDRIVRILEPLRADRERLLEFVKPDGGYHAHAKVSQRVKTAKTANTPGVKRR